MTDPRPLRAAGESSASRRARVKKQLRDKKGRWIEMGGGVSWSAPSGSQYTGIASDIQGDSVIVTNIKYKKLDGSTGTVATNALVPANKITASPKAKASLADKIASVEQFKIPQAEKDATQKIRGGSSKVWGGSEQATAPAAPANDKKFEVLADSGKSGDGWFPGTGNWGKYGAAGVFVRHVDENGVERFLLVKNGPLVTQSQGLWQLPGGALNSKENDYQGTAREMSEELSPPDGYVGQLTAAGEVRFDHPSGWHYTNIAADSPTQFTPKVDQSETSDAKWLTKDEIAALPLHPALKANLDNIYAQFSTPGAGVTETNRDPGFISDGIDPGPIPEPDADIKARGQMLEPKAAPPTINRELGEASYKASQKVIDLVDEATVYAQNAGLDVDFVNSLSLEDDEYASPYELMDELQTLAEELDGKGEDSQSPMSVDFAVDALDNAINAIKSEMEIPAYDDQSSNAAPAPNAKATPPEYKPSEDIKSWINEAQNYAVDLDENVSLILDLPVKDNEIKGPVTDFYDDITNALEDLQDQTRGYPDPQSPLGIVTTALKNAQALVKLDLEAEEGGNNYDGAPVVPQPQVNPRTGDPMPESSTAPFTDDDPDPRGVNGPDYQFSPDSYADPDPRGVGDRPSPPPAFTDTDAGESRDPEADAARAWNPAPGSSSVRDPLSEPAAEPTPASAPTPAPGLEPQAAALPPHTYKTPPLVDGNGNKYVTAGDGNPIFVGATVVNSTKGYEGVVVGLENNGVGVKVKVESTGNIHALNTLKLAVTNPGPNGQSSSAPAAAEPAPVPTPEPEAPALPSVRDALTPAELQALPVGAKITMPMPGPNVNGSVATATKNPGGATYTMDLDGLVNPGMPASAVEATGPWTLAPPSYDQGERGEVFTDADLAAMPVGTVLKTTKPSAVSGLVNDLTMTKKGDDNWTFTSNTKTLPNMPDAVAVGLNPWIKTDPAPVPTADFTPGNPATVEWMNQTSPGAKMENKYQPDAYASKQENGLWSYTEEGDTDEDITAGELMYAAEDNWTISDPGVPQMREPFSTPTATPAPQPQAPAAPVAPAATADPPHVFKTPPLVNAAGQKYVTTSNGVNIKVGDTVTSTNLGWSGTVKSIENNGVGVKVINPATGKQSALNLMKLTAEKPANAPSQTAPTSTPTAPAAAPTPAAPAKNPGDTFDAEWVKNAPAGASIKSPGEMVFTKNGPNSWISGLSGSKYQDADVQNLGGAGWTVNTTGAPAATNPNLDQFGQPKLEEAEGFIEGADVSIAQANTMPPGSVIYSTVSDEYATKQGDGSWTFDTDTFQPTSTISLDYNPSQNKDTTNGWVVEKLAPTPFPATDWAVPAVDDGPDPALYNVGDWTDSSFVDLAPTGAVVTNAEGYQLTKNEDGTWLSQATDFNGNPHSFTPVLAKNVMSEGVWTIDSMGSAPASTPPVPSLVGTKPEGSWANDAPVGAKAMNPNSGYTLEKTGEDGWTSKAGYPGALAVGGTPNSDVEYMFANGNWQITDEGPQSAASPANARAAVESGTSVVDQNHSFVDSNLLVSDANPSSPLYGTSEPKMPTPPPAITDPQYVSDEWLDKAREIYKNEHPGGKYKPLDQSSYWFRFEQVKTTGNQQALDTLVSLKYITPEMSAEITERVDEHAAIQAAATQAHLPVLTAYKKQLADWRAANGVSAAQAIGAPKNSTQSFYGGPADWTKAHAGTPTADAAFSALRASVPLSITGISVATDSGDIEDLDVNTIRVVGLDGETRLESRFKVTAAAGDKIAKAMIDRTDATTTSGVAYQARDFDPKTGLPRYTSGDTFVASNGQTTVVKDPATGAVITFMRKKNTIKTPLSIEAYHNSVRISMPENATSADFQSALTKFGISSAAPASEADIKAYAINKLLSVAGGNTDPTKNIEDKTKQESTLQKIQAKYTIGLEDMVLTMNTNGRMQMMLSDESRDVLIKKLNVKGFNHQVYIETGESTESVASKIVNMTAGPGSGAHATNKRWSEGIGKKGMSSAGDMRSGGADYIYTRVMHEDTVKTTYGATIVMHPKAMMRRLDLYGNQSDNGVGQHYDNVLVYDLMKGTPNEIQWKKSVPVSEMWYIPLEQKYRDEVLKQVKSKGITQVNGIPVEQFYIPYGATPPPFDESKFTSDVAPLDAVV